MDSSLMRLFRRIAVRFWGHGPRNFSCAATLPASETLFFQTGSLFSGYAGENSFFDRCRLLREPDRRSMLINEAGLYDDDGVIYDLKTRNAVEETLGYYGTLPIQHPVFTLPRALPPVRLEGLSVFLGGLGGQTFYHFLLETIPKFVLLKMLIGKADRLIVQSYMEEQKQSWLDAAGLRLPIQWLQPLNHYHCEQLAFALPVARPAEANPWIVQQIRNIFGVAQSCKKQSRRIWINRTNAQTRNVPWEADVIRMLPTGWESVDFAQIPPKKTLEICQTIEVLAGFHGAGFANTCFIPPGAKVLEFLINPERPWYSNLSRSCGHHHRTIHDCLSPMDVIKNLESS